MCWRRSKLLRCDEPVAGMTDVETHQTPSCSRNQQGQAIMVVEHDMTFVRELGVKGHLPARRHGTGGGNIDQVSSNSG